jgi:hypothetical protein
VLYISALSPQNFCVALHGFIVFRPVGMFRVRWD